MIDATNPVLNAFYFTSFLIILVISYRKSRKLTYSIELALSIIIIGSQFWEIPVFVCAYVGLFGYWTMFPYDLLYDAVILIVALLVIARTNLKFKWWHIPLILASIGFIGFITIGLLHIVHGLNKMQRYILGFTGRGIGLTVLTYILVVGNPCFGKS